MSTAPESSIPAPRGARACRRKVRVGDSEMSFAVRQKIATAVAAAAALIGLLGSVVVAAPAIAAPFSAVLDLGKSVDKTAVAPGQSFTYTLTPSCSSGDCLDAT